MINLSRSCYYLLVHRCGTSDDTYMKALPAQIALTTIISILVTCALIKTIAQHPVAIVSCSVVSLLIYNTIVEL